MADNVGHSGSNVVVADNLRTRFADFGFRKSYLDALLDGVEVHHARLALDDLLRRYAADTLGSQRAWVLEGMVEKAVVPQCSPSASPGSCRYNLILLGNLFSVSGSDLAGADRKARFDVEFKFPRVHIYSLDAADQHHWEKRTKGTLSGAVCNKYLSQDLYKNSSGVAVLTSMDKDGFIFGRQAYHVNVLSLNRRMEGLSIALVYSRGEIIKAATLNTDTIFYYTHGACSSQFPNVLHFSEIKPASATIDELADALIARFLNNDNFPGDSLAVLPCFRTEDRVIENGHLLRSYFSRDDAGNVVRKGSYYVSRGYSKAVVITKGNSVTIVDPSTGRVIKRFPSKTTGIELDRLFNGANGFPHVAISRVSTDSEFFTDGCGSLVYCFNVDKLSAELVQQGVLQQGRSLRDIPQLGICRVYKGPGNNKFYLLGEGINGNERKAEIAETKVKLRGNYRGVVSTIDSWSFIPSTARRDIVYNYGFSDVEKMVGRLSAKISAVQRLNSISPSQVQLAEFNSSLSTAFLDFIGILVSYHQKNMHAYLHGDMDFNSRSELNMRIAMKEIDTIGSVADVLHALFAHEEGKYLFSSVSRPNRFTSRYFVHLQDNLAVEHYDMKIPDAEVMFCRDSPAKYSFRITVFDVLNIARCLLADSGRDASYCTLSDEQMAMRLGSNFKLAADVRKAIYDPGSQMQDRYKCLSGVQLSLGNDDMPQLKQHMFGIELKNSLAEDRQLLIPRTAYTSLEAYANNISCLLNVARQQFLTAVDYYFRAVSEMSSANRASRCR